MKKIIIPLLILLLAPIAALALSNNGINFNLEYQKDGSLYSGTKNVVFNYYYLSSGGSIIATENHDIVFSNGRGNVALTNVTGLDWSNNVWLEAKIDGVAVMTPRLQMWSSADAQNNPFNYVNGKAILKNGSTKLGLGVLDPLAKLHVVGDAIITGNITTSEIVGATTDPNGAYNMIWGGPTSIKINGGIDMNDNGGQNALIVHHNWNGVDFNNSYYTALVGQDVYVYKFGADGQYLTTTDLFPGYLTFEDYTNYPARDAKEVLNTSSKQIRMLIYNYTGGNQEIFEVTKDAFTYKGGNVCTSTNGMCGGSSSFWDNSSGQIVPSQKVRINRSLTISGQNISFAIAPNIDDTYSYSYAPINAYVEDTSTAGSDYPMMNLELARQGSDAKTHTALRVMSTKAGSYDAVSIMSRPQFLGAGGNYTDYLIDANSLDIASSLDNKFGVRIKDVNKAMSGAQYGLHIGNLTSGSSDYGIYIQGADTNAIYVNSGNSYFGGNITVSGTNTCINWGADGMTCHNSTCIWTVSFSDNSTTATGSGC